MRPAVDMLRSEAGEARSERRAMGAVVEARRCTEVANVREAMVQGEIDWRGAVFAGLMYL